MASLGELFVKIGLDATEFNKSLTGITSKLDDAGKKMQDVGKSMSTYITAPMVLMGGAAIKSAADLETMEVAFTSMLGSGEAASEMVKDLVDFTAKTPFQLEGVGGAAKQLLSFGVSADEVQEKLKFLGDISAGAGVPLNEMAAIFGKVKAKGKAMTEEILQLSDRGIPIIDVLAKKMGVAKSEIFDMASKSKISFDIMQDALKSMSNEGGIFANQMDKQSSTLAGVFSTLQDNISLASAELGKSLVETFKLKEVMAALIENIQKGVEWFKSLSDGQKKAIMITAGLVAAVGPLLIALGFLSSTIIPGLITGLGMLLSPIGLIAVAIAGLVTVFLFFKDEILAGWEVIKFFVKNVIDAFSNVGKIIKAVLKGEWDKIGPLWKKAGENLGKNTIEGFKTVYKNNLPKEIKDAIKPVKPKAEKFGEKTGEVISDAIVKEVATRVPKALETADIPKKLSKQITKSIANNLPDLPMPTTIKVTNGITFSKFEALIGKVSNTVRAFGKALKDKAIEGLKNFGKSLGSGLRGAGSVITSRLTMFGGAIDNLMDGNWIGAIISVFGDIANQSKVFIDVLGRINDAVEGSLSTMMPMFDKLFSSLEPLVPIIVSLSETFMEMLLSVMQPILPPLLKLVGIVVDLIGSLKPLIAVIGDVLGVVLDMAIKHITPLIEPLKSVFSMLTKVVSALGPIIEILGDILTPIFEIIGQVLTNVVAPILEVVGSILQVIAPILELVAISLITLEPVLRSISFAMIGFKNSMYPIIILFEWLGGVLSKFVEWLEGKLSALGINTSMIGQAGAGQSQLNSQYSPDFQPQVNQGYVSGTQNNLNVTGEFKVFGTDLIAVLKNNERSSRNGG